MEFERRLGPYLSCHREPTYGCEKPCGSWVYSPKSNIHITRDREWFEDDYMAFSSIIYHSRHKPWDNAEDLTKRGEEPDPEDFSWAHGVGTVKLKTKRSPNKSGGRNRGEIILKNVIFAPDYICNIIGGNITQDGYVVEVDYNYTNQVRDPSVDIGEKPWLEEELQWLKDDGHDPDEHFETFKKHYAEKGPQYAKKADSDLMIVVFRDKLRTLWVKNPFQQHFDHHRGYRESDDYEWAFSAAQIDFVSKTWGKTMHFMNMFGYKSGCEDDCMMAAVHVKDLMREEGLEVSSEDDMGEDGSGWEDTDEDMCECEHDKCECVGGID
ncbi:uncharacterized protein FMAN_01729 [Fusarium mangiferae]|uniref:Uncharacterized protein n=1 Tax=Fusarium mangiferae TaxID=192010 RepID=A0A1L7SP08_FUSMA|nr:uncharacterized protein FMAN_01729 [Fusarium mangiferae]CVK84802.1 uncharacterized protein FMAN_01729 [Fusarium mangiferae]